jgi:hypothetical protein
VSLRAEQGIFSIRPAARLGLIVALLLAFGSRVAAMVAALMAGNESYLLAFPLSVIFPAVLVVLLVIMPAAKSREGALMRLGTIIQLILIVLFPAINLYLALGLPVVFLVVELFETRLPVTLRRPLTNMFIA